MRPHVGIVGAGIAGLSAAIHLLQAGFEVTICEQGARPGGLCVGWRRGDYAVNGCLHWVLGVRAGTSFYKYWKEIVDIDKLRLIDFDIRAEIEVPFGDGQTFTFKLYNDVDRLEAYLKELSPSDSKVIGQWMSAIRQIVPLLDDLPPYWSGKSFLRKTVYAVRLMRLAAMLPFMWKWSEETNVSFARRFQSERLRAAVERLYMQETGMNVIIFGQAYMAARVAAYPEGGSEALTDLLYERFVGLGGALRRNAAVSEIVVEEHKACGLLLESGERLAFDAVVSAADWRWTMQEALHAKYLRESQSFLTASDKRLFFHSYCRIHLGVAQDLAAMPHFFRLAETLVLPDGTATGQMEVEVNCYDKTSAPKGKSTLTVSLPTSEGQWWIELRQKDIQTYRQVKDELASLCIATLARRFPECFSQDKVEVADVATPATYWRYTRNTLGSSQGWRPRQNLLHRLPIGEKVDGLSCFAIAGHWLEAGGGLPVAMLSGRRAAKLIERQLKRE